MKRRQLDLADELNTIRKAMKGVLVLTEMASPLHAPDAEAAAEAPELAVAVTALVVERLRQLERAVRGTADVEPLLAAHNVAVGPAEGAVRVQVWSNQRRRAEAERELRRLEVERRARRRR